jgi:hypothetical protein
VLVYVVTDQILDEFRVFLERHAPVLHALRAWTLRIVVPPDLPKIGQRAKQVVWNQLLTPLEAEVIAELRWYFGRVALPRPRESLAIGGSSTVGAGLSRSEYCAAIPTLDARCRTARSVRELGQGDRVLLDQKNSVPLAFIADVFQNV